MKTHLCVGGPKDGLRVAVKDGTCFTVAVSERRSVRDFSSVEDVPTVVKTDCVTYREETFHSDGGDLAVWVPEGQTTFDTVQRLLIFYEHHRWNLDATV